MKTVLTIQFVETENAMIKNCIRMISTGVEHRIISDENNKVVIDATNCDLEKLLSVAGLLGETEYVKRVSVDTQK